jgi:hypothetical protein
MADVAPTLHLADAALKKSLPFFGYEYVDVTFTAAHTDTVIPYGRLSPASAQDVQWLDVTPNTVVSGSTEEYAKIYQSQLSTRTAWEHGYVVLRATAAPYRTRLLLSVPVLPAIRAFVRDGISRGKFRSTPAALAAMGTLRIVQDGRWNATPWDLAQWVEWALVASAALATPPAALSAQGRNRILGNAKWDASQWDVNQWASGAITGATALSSVAATVSGQATQTYSGTGAVTGAAATMTATGALGNALWDHAQWDSGKWV